LYYFILSPFFIFWTPSGINKYLCSNGSYAETTCSAYVWPRWVQGQGQNWRFNIVWLYFMSALYLLNPWFDLQNTHHKCQKWWDDVQCLCLTNVCSRSRSQFKILHCMTVFGSAIRYIIYFEPLLVFTNNFARMSALMRQCAMLLFDQGQLKVKYKV